MTDADDPIAFELFRNAIFSIADEMALTIFRTTYSGVLKDNMDYSTAFCDAERQAGGAGADPARAISARFRPRSKSSWRDIGDDMAPGDVFVMNDPFEGGMHLPDIFVFKPLYFEGERHRVRRHDLPPHRRRRPGRRLERLGLHRDLPGGPAHPAAQAVRRGPAATTTLFALIEKNVRVPVQGVRRPARPARRLPHRRAPVPASWSRATAPRRDQALHGGRDRLRRALTRSGAAGPARRPVELRGLDRRRRRRRRQADPPVRHHDQAGRSHAGRLDRHRSAGQGRDQQHALLHQGRELHRDPLGAAGRTSRTTRACSARSR